jgi:hypothetical protein
MFAPDLIRVSQLQPGRNRDKTMMVRTSQLHSSRNRSIKRQRRARLSGNSNVLRDVVVQLLLLRRQISSNVLSLRLLGLELNHCGFELEDLVLDLSGLHMISLHIIGTVVTDVPGEHQLRRRSPLR